MKLIYPTVIAAGAVIGGYVGMILFAPSLMSGQLLEIVSSSDPVYMEYRQKIMPSLMLTTGIGVILGSVVAFTIAAVRKYRQKPDISL